MQRLLNQPSVGRWPRIRGRPERFPHRRRGGEPVRLAATWRAWISCWTFVIALLAPAPLLAAAQPEAVAVRLTDDPSAGMAGEIPSQLPRWFLPDDGLSVDEALFQDQSLRPVPRVAPAPTVLPVAGEELATDLFSSGWGVRRSLLPDERWTQTVGIGADLVRMQEAVVRSTTDTGSLLGESPSAVGLGLQRRNPIVNDPRIRGSRIGRLPASGSYWVPARMDLDTMLSKLDSRLIDDVLIINGPYAARYGPGFSFVDVALLPTPRFDEGFQVGGSTSFDYKANGDQVYGRQTFSGGADCWGFRAGYGHRTGNDYTSGNGQPVAASYNSRDVDLALGRDFGGDSATDQRVEFRYLRLDQTGVELPGQAFDIDLLYTDAYEVTYRCGTDILKKQLGPRRSRAVCPCEAATQPKMFPANPGKARFWLFVRRPLPRPRGVKEDEE